MPKKKHSNSPPFIPERDAARLARQRERIYAYMLANYPNWTTLEITSETLANMYRVRFPEPSVSASFRDFRKKHFGGHEVQRRYVIRGLWEYRVIPHSKKKLRELAKQNPQLSFWTNTPRVRHTANTLDYDYKKIMERKVVRK